MKLCHVVLRPRFSGAELIVGHLMREQVANGHEVMIASLEPTEQSFADSVVGWEHSGAMLAIPTHSVERRGLRKFVSRLSHLRSAFKKFQPDVVFAHATIPSYYSRFVAVGRPRVVTVLHAQQNYAGHRESLLESKLCPKPAHVIAVSPVAADEYKSRFGCRIKVSVVPNGIDLRQFGARSNLCPAPPAFPDVEGQFVFIQVGRIDRNKNQITSLRAFAALPPELRSRAVLVFAGIEQDAAYGQALTKAAEQFGLTSVVLRLGARPDVPNLLRNSSAYLMPSFVEAHSVALLEALAAKLPVIASDIKSFQFAREYPGVWLIEPDDVDAMSRQMVEVQQAGRMSFDRDLSRFDLRAMAAEYERIAEEVMSSK